MQVKQKIIIIHNTNEHTNCNWLIQNHTKMININ